MAETLEDVLFAVILLLFLSRVLGLLLRRFGIAELVGNVAAGLILGPLLIFGSDLFGLSWGIRPAEPLEVFADFGILFLMLFTGLMTDFHSFRQVRKASVIVGVGGVLVTFGLIFAALMAVNAGLHTSLFIAAILGNTAIEVSAGILQRFPESKLKSVVIGASFVDDIVAVILIAIVSSTVFSESFDIGAVGWIGIEVAVFLLISLVISSWLIDRMLDKLVRKEENVLLTATLLIGLSFALLAGQLRLHPVIGAYVAGFVIGRWGSTHDPMLDHSIARGKLIEEIKAPLNALFAPFFFGYVGLLFVTAGDLEWPVVIGLMGLLLTLAIAGKVIGCGLGAIHSGFPRKEGLVIGLAMGGRGGLELVLLRFGLESNVVTATEFTAIVGVILMTVLLSPILFRRSSRQLLNKG